MRAGVAVVGGGPLGAWLALEAAGDGDPLRAPVVLLEAGDLAAAAGPLELVDPGGDLGPVLDPGLDPRLAPLLRDGARALANIEPQTGRPVGHGRPGAVLVGDTSSVERGEPVDAAWLERRGLAPPSPARVVPDLAVVDPVRTHAEVLALARTRGAITRPGTTALALSVEGGRVVGLETDRGSVATERVVLCCPRSAGELLAGAGLPVPPLVLEPWREAAYPAPLVRAEAGLGDLPPGGLAELTADPSALEAFFASGEPVEAPHPALLDLATGGLAAANPLAGELVLLARGPDRAPEELLSWLPVHGDLGPARPRAGVADRSADGLPWVGRQPDLAGLWLGLGLGRAAGVLAPALAPGLAADLEGRPVAAYDPTLLAPGR